MLECHAQRAGSSGHLHIYELSYSSSDADQFLGPIRITNTSSVERKVIC